jgi:hypothetical protein
MKWIFKHKDADTFPGTWLIASDKLSAEEIEAVIAASPGKYGDPADWLRCS